MQNRTDEPTGLAQSRRRAADDGAGQLCAESWCDMPRAGTRRYLAADASPIFDDDGDWWRWCRRCAT